MIDPQSKSLICSHHGKIVLPFSRNNPKHCIEVTLLPAVLSYVELSCFPHMHLEPLTTRFVRDMHKIFVIKIYVYKIQSHKSSKIYFLFSHLLHIRTMHCNGAKTNIYLKKKISPTNLQRYIWKNTFTIHMNSQRSSLNRNTTLQTTRYLHKLDNIKLGSTQQQKMY